MVKSSLCGMRDFWSKQRNGSRIKVVIAKDVAEAKRNTLNIVSKEISFLKSKYGLRATISPAAWW